MIKYFKKYLFIFKKKIRYIDGNNFLWILKCSKNEAVKLKQSLHPNTNQFNKVKHEKNMSSVN